MVTHDKDMAEKADRIIYMKDGEIQLNPLYVFEEDENSTLDRVSGRLKRTDNKMQNVFKLQLTGIREEI